MRGAMPAPSRRSGRSISAPISSSCRAASSTSSSTATCSSTCAARRKACSASSSACLRRGGHHFLSVPVSGEETREDLTDELSPAERSMLFGQADHFRIFGRRALPQMLDRVWGKSERHHIEPAELFSAEELESAAIRKRAWSGISSHSIFHHLRPGCVRCASRKACRRAPRVKCRLSRLQRASARSSSSTSACRRPARPRCSAG